MSDSLHELQQCFQAHVLDGHDAMLEHVAPDVKPSAAARLAIYAKGYRLRLLEALATEYPALHTLAGDETFEQLGRAYIDAYPSNHYSIRYFGQHLSAFLAVSPPYCESPALSEMAALEWALSLAFDAADAAVLGIESLAALPPAAWPEMRLHFHASLQRRDFHWNMPELWTAIDQQDEPQIPQTYPQARAWLIWRRDLQNYFRPLDLVEAGALDTMRAGADFATLCESLYAHIDAEQVSLQAVQFLKGWIEAGLVVSLDSTR
jgi:hypothetical protein